MSANFQPTTRDVEGLESLGHQIRRDQLARDGSHEGYHVSCFQEAEARWIEKNLKSRFPELARCISISWLQFPGS